MCTQKGKTSHRNYIITKYVGCAHMLFFAHIELYPDFKEQNNLHIFGIFHIYDELYVYY